MVPKIYWANPAFRGLFKVIFRILVQRAQDGAQMAPEGAKMAQDRAKIAQDRPKTAQDRPNIAQDRPKMVKDRPKMAQDGAKMAPRSASVRKLQPHKTSRFFFEGSGSWNVFQAAGSFEGLPRGSCALPSGS